MVSQRQDFLLSWLEDNIPLYMCVYIYTYVDPSSLSIRPLMDM